MTLFMVVPRLHSEGIIPLLYCAAGWLSSHLTEASPGSACLCRLKGGESLRDLSSRFVRSHPNGRPTWLAGEFTTKGIRTTMSKLRSNRINSRFENRRSSLTPTNYPRSECSNADFIFEIALSGMPSCLATRLHCETASPTCLAILFASDCLTPNSSATSSDRLSEASAESNVIAVLSTRGLSSTGTGFRS